MARVKKETFKIIWQCQDFHELREVKGERITIAGIPCFIFKEPEEDMWGAFDGWNVTHLETGMRHRFTNMNLPVLYVKL